MRPKTSDALNGLPTGSSRGSDGSEVGKGESTSPGDVRFVRGVVMARMIDKIENENRRNRHLARQAANRKCTTRRKKARRQIDGV